MYKMLYGDRFLFDPFDDERIVGDAKLTNNINAASYLDFTIYPGHPLYDVIEERSETVRLWWDNEELFKGQIYKIDIGMEGLKSVSCNSALEHLKDVQLRPYSTDAVECEEYEYPLDKAPDTLAGYFQWVIDQYNELNLTDTRFSVHVNQADYLTDRTVYFSSTSAQTVADAIDQNILGSYGGYLSLRYKDDELMLDLYSDIHEMNPQIIDFGENILDITKAEDTTDQYTAIYPTGYTPQYTKEQQKYHDEKAIYDQTMEDRDNAQRAKIDKLKREEDAEQRRIDGMPKGEAKTNAQNALKRRKEQREAQEKSFQQETERLRDQQRVKDDKNSADKTKPNPITIESLPDGGYSGDLDILKRGDVIYSASAVERYGYKEYAYSESDVEDKEVLLRLAVVKLKTLMAPVTTVVVRAVDQATYHAEHTHLFVGQAVRVRSKIQHVDEYMMVSSIELDLNDPSRTTATLGVAYDTLTGQQSSYLKNLNSQIVASVDEVKKVSEDVKTTEITIGKLENAVVENKEQHDILVNTVESSQWVSNTAYDNAQEASEAAAKANEDIQEVNTTLDEHNAKLEALDESAKAMDGKIKETEEKAQNAVASIETLRTDVETDIQGVRDDVAAVSDKADTIKTEANKAIEGVKASVNAVSDRAEAINTAATSAIAGVRNEVQNVKTSAENANAKANELQKSLDDANAVIETHTTKLGGLETTLSNTTQTAESALSVASSAKLEAGQVKITANSAYADAQSALTKASELKSDIDGLSLNLSNNYYGKGDADALFATNASLQATSNGIKTEVSKTYATKESVDTLQNIADNAIESWTGTTVPTASNAPANTWTTKELKKRHSGDIYYNMSTGKSYRWGSTDGNTYSWTMIADNDITKALADAAKAQQTADGAKTDVVNLSNNVKATYASKADLEITSDEIKQEVSAVSSTANTNKTDIANLKLRADGLETNFQSTSNTLKGHTEAIGRLEVKADGLSANFSSLSDLTEEAMANAEEKVTNGGFESGDYGWYTSPVVENFTQQTPYAHSGNRQMIFDRRTKELLQKVVRSTSVVSGRRYRFGVWYRTIDGTKNAGISGGLRLQQSSDGSNFRDWRSVDIPVAHLTGPADWKYICVDGIPDDSVKFIRARVAFTGAPSLALDDVSIKDITDAYEAITKTSEIRSDLDGFKQTASQIYETKDASSQKIQEVKTSVNGLTSTVSSVSTTANSALEKSTKLEQSVDGFKSEVSQTYATKTELSDELKNTAKSYNITGGLVRWNNVGRIVIPQQGKNAVLDFSYGHGFNGINDQQCSVRVELRTSNRPGTNPEPNRISATITGLLRATHFSMKIYYEGGDTYNLWVRDVGNYIRGTVTVYGVVDFTVIDQMVAEGVNDPTDTGTEQTSIGKQELTNTTYVDQTSERIALNSIRNYRDADGNTLVNSGQLAVSANQIKSEVAQTYTTKNEFNNLKIGGRNLWVWKGFLRQYVGNQGIIEGSNQTVDATMATTVPCAGEKNVIIQSWNLSDKTVSTGNATGRMAFYKADGTFIKLETTISYPNCNYKYSTKTVPIPAEAAYFRASIVYPGGPELAGDPSVFRVKFEFGNKPTDWTPAPEDMVSQTEAKTTYTTKSEFTQEKDKITLSVSEAATTANSALSKANALEVTAGKLQSTISEHATSISGNTTNISKLTQTANSLTSELSQVSNIADIAYNKTDNLIIDGGFEDGTKTWPNIARAGWRFTDGTRRTGSYAVRKEVSTTIGTLYLTHKPTECIDTQGSIAGRPLDLIPGRIYRFSCWIYPTNGAAGAPDKCKVRIGAASNGSHIWSKAFNTFPQNTWTELTFDYTATAENPRIFLNVQCDNTAGIYCFDDFSFRDVTEAKAAQTTANDAISRYSTLKQDLDGFKTTVGQTYETKTDALSKKSSLETTINSFKTEVSTTYAKQTALTTVSDKLDNLKIGGRNLAVYNQLTNYNSNKFSYDRTTNTYTMVASVGTSVWGYGARIKRNDASINRHNVLVPWGMTIIKSFEAYSPVDAQISSDFDLYPVTGDIWNSNDNDLGSSRSPTRVSIKGGEWTKVWWRTTNADPRNTNKLDLVDNSTFGLITSGFTQPTEWKIRNFKAELGNIPTDWTPAPEDMATALELSEQKSYIDQQDSKIELGVQNTYQTKADMAGYAKTADVESKISASKSGILLEVSNKYASKELPQQLIDNLKVGDTNLLQRTQWLDRTGVSSSETGYLMVVPASYDSTNYLGKFKVGKVTSSVRELLQYTVYDVEPNTDYVFSWYGKGTSNINAYFYGPTGYIKAIAVDYSDGMSFVNNAYADGKISFQMTSEWKRYWVHWKTAETMNGATTKAKYVLLRDDSNVRDAYAAAPKLEKGTKPTEWSPSPWDLGDAQTLREQGTKIEQNANNIALKVSTKDLAFGDNIWPNQWCEPSTADNPRYQIGSPYTGTEAAPSGGKIFQLNSRDHYNGDFPLRMPSRLRIIVEAKRIAGTRNLNAGIWRKQRTEGNAWSYVSVTKRENLTNGWQRLTYDINNNSGRVGALYFQIDQSGSSPDTTWLISNIRFYDITDSEELNAKIDVRADAITSEVSQKINDISIGSRNLMKLAWMGPYTNNTTWNYSNYFQDGGFSFTRTNSRDGGVYMDNYQGVQANKEYIVHFQLRVKEGNVSKIYIYVGLNGTTNNTPETGLFIDGVRKGNGGVDIPFTPVLNQWYDIEYRYRTSASSVNKAEWNGHVIQLNKNESGINYTAEVRGFMWEEGNKPTGWNPAPEDMASSSMVVQTKDAITTTITQQVNTINQTTDQLKKFAAQPTTLIGNGGFESGDSTGWTIINSSTGVNSNGVANTGKYRCLLSPQDTTKRSELVSDAFIITPGRTYEVTAWVCADDTNIIAIGFDNNNVNVAPSAAGKYVRISSGPITPSSGGTRKVYIGKTLTTNKYLRIDDVQVVDITDAQSINNTNKKLDSTSKEVSTINSNVNTLQTYITQKSEGILVGKNVNGTPTGYVARVNSMGSFDILDSSRNNRVVASMGTDGLEYRKYYDNNHMPADAYTNWTIGFQTVQSGPQTTFMLPDLKFPIGTAFNSWPGNGTAWNIVRDRFQQPGTVYRAQNVGGNGFCCYDSSYNNTTYGIYSSADVVPQQGVKFVNVSAIRKILETKTGSYAGYDYESWKYFLYSYGLFLSTHNDSSDPNATPTPGSTNFKSVVLMSPGVYLISAIADIRQPTSGTILGDVWFQWNLNGGINDWKPVYGCPIYTALWNGGQDSGGDKPGHWVRSTIPATVVSVKIPCIRVALRLPPDIEVGSRTQMNIVRLPFSHSYDI